MTITNHRTKRLGFHSDAARKAAAAARAAQQLLKPEVGTPEVYVVRDEADPRLYVWQVRRHGGVVLVRGQVAHPSRERALAVGRAALAVLSGGLGGQAHARGVRVAAST